ncbi:MAG: nitroreductase [Bacillota bacterium]
MELDVALKGRRAVREFRSQGLDDATIERLIDAAVQAPSAVNEQPWTFTVVRDPVVLDRLAEEAKAYMLATMPREHVERFRPRLSDPSFHIFYHAPALILISAVSKGPWIQEDCALAAENLMLAAYGEGLGTCWIGFAQGYLNTPQGKRLVGIPEAWVPVAPIIVGHPKAFPAAHERRRPTIRWIN